MGAGEFDLFVGDIHERDFNEDAVLALSPSDYGVPELLDTYSMLND